VAFGGVGFRADGLLRVRDGVTVVPYVWQDVPGDVLPELLRDIRRVIGPKVSSAVVEGAVMVMPIHYRGEDRDAVMLVNLTGEDRDVTLRLAGPRLRLADLDGRPVEAEMRLEPDEVRVVQAF